MKKSIIKIWRVGLTLAMVCSLLAFAVPTPVAAAPGAQQWTAQTLPTVTGLVLASGTDVTDIAVANDGSTVYVIDGLGACNAAGFCVRSTNGGQTFTATAVPAGAGGGAPRAIAVAPDNPDVVAVIEATAGTNLVHTSSNGGVTWSTLGAFAAAPAAGDAMDIAIGPARSGTLLGREFAVAIADPTTATIAMGDVQIIGGTAAWATVGSAGNLVLAQRDYMSVAFTPNFVGDRCVVVVGATATPNFATLEIINTASNTIVTRTVFGTTTIDYDRAGGVASSILSADIALPADFDPSTASGRRSFAAITSFAPLTDNDVYRIDNLSARALGAVTALGVQSIAYSGTIDEGILLMGATASNTIRYSSNPQVSLPTWTACKKGPSLAGNTNTVVRAAADFATTSRVYAGTTGAESAFHVSNNGGISFDAESMIDSIGANTVIAINDAQLTPDGKYIYMVTNDATELSLWKSTTPVGSSSWSRIFVVTATGPGIVRINPEWTDSPTVYFLDTAAGGLGGVNNVFVSTTGGDIFSPRSSPIAATLILDAAVENATTIYVAQGANVYKSTTSSWTFGTAKSSKLAAVNNLAVAKTDHVLAGGAGACSYSTDGGSSFTQIPATAGITYTVMADDGYEDNNTFYAADTTAAAVTGMVYRYIIGEDTALVGLTNTNSTAVALQPLVGLAMANGALYVQADGSAAAFVAGVANASGCDRNLAPLAAPGTVAAIWDTMTVGLNQAAVVAPLIAGITAATGSNVVYIHDGTVTLRAYNDLFATTAPVLQGPADGTTLGVDPVNGRADPFVLSIGPVGTGAGAGNRVDIAIREKGDAWVPAPTIGNVGVSSTGPTVVINNAILTAAAYVLKANTEYEWRVRFDNQVSGDLVRTPYSAAFTLKVGGGTVVQQPHAGPVIIGPTDAATADTSLTPGIAWAPLSGATKYQVILATDATLKSRVAGTPVFVTAPAWQPAENLAYGTTYFFAIMAVEPTASPQAIGSFTTMAKPVPPAPPVTIAPAPAPQITLPAPVINIPPSQQISPPFIWAIVIIGAILIIAVIVLIVRTRRPM